ncbi:hypothetical protein Tco_0358081 [Tanacetum coccineum]
MGQLKSLQALDLSRNELSGNIPLRTAATFAGKEDDVNNGDTLQIFILCFVESRKRLDICNSGCASSEIPKEV